MAAATVTTPPSGAPRLGPALAQAAPGWRKRAAALPSRPTASAPVSSMPVLQGMGSHQRAALHSARVHAGQRPDSHRRVDPGPEHFCQEPGQVGRQDMGGGGGAGRGRARCIVCLQVGMFSAPRLLPRHAAPTWLPSASTASTPQGRVRHTCNEWRPCSGGGRGAECAALHPSCHTQPSSLPAAPHRPCHQPLPRGCNLWHRLGVH